MIFTFITIPPVNVCVMPALCYRTSNNEQRVDM